MAFQPAGSLSNRTFVGLIIAQFLAGFNDQAIHAVGMFYAIKVGILTEAQAISLMPILFYAPWAIFCTLSGHFADRYSKTYTLVFWKGSEIAISLVLILGFMLGGTNPMGGWLVLACVFLMGTHAAFFAPAKYGAMPEILQPHVLSRGNGILESTTFLAAILGTVSGGLLFFQFRDNEVVIGYIVLGLSVIGALASALIAYLPPASPDKPFPYNPFKPLWDSLKVLLKSRPLALSALGIAFFVFMVTYMRTTVYMHGQTRNPPWDEFRVSMIVATVALGVGLGAPFAGYLSGGKIELGLVPVGCLGMIFATLLSAMEINTTAVLVAALVVIGFFSGFYMVPLYTLIQHRAPKSSKASLIATSNFINVTGAMAASVLFLVLVQIGIATGVTPEVRQDDVAAGKLVGLNKDDHGHVDSLSVETQEGVRKFVRNVEGVTRDLIHQFGEPSDSPIELADDGLLGLFGNVPQQGDEVVVSGYKIGTTQRYNLRKADQARKPVYDNEALPRYLFIGAALMTAGILILLWRKLPDFFVRTLYWMRSLGKFHLKAVGMQHLPTDGPVILATNCDRLENSLQLVSATDRYTAVVLVETPANKEGGSLLRRLADRSNLVVVHHPHQAESWDQAQARAHKALDNGNLLAVGVDGQDADAELGSFLHELRDQTGALIVPVFCGPLDPSEAKPQVRVVFGEPAPADATLEDLRRRVARLAEWIRANDATAGAAH